MGVEGNRGMSGVNKIVALLGAFLVGAADADKSAQQVVTGDAGHVGCYYDAWAYTRPGMGEFWPEDIDTSLCDVIYYGYGNVLNNTYEVSTWDHQTMVRHRSRTVSKRGTGTLGHLVV